MFELFLKTSYQLLLKLHAEHGIYDWMVHHMVHQDKSIILNLQLMFRHTIILFIYN